jgi:hypothetical protein
MQQPPLHFWTTGSSTAFSACLSNPTTAVLQGRACPALGTACNCKCEKHLLLLQRADVRPMRMPTDEQRMNHVSIQLISIILGRCTCHKAAVTQLSHLDRSITPDPSTGLLGRLQHLILLLDVPYLDVDARLPSQRQRLDVLVGIGRFDDVLSPLAALCLGHGVTQRLHLPAPLHHSKEIGVAGCQILTVSGQLLQLDVLWQLLLGVFACVLGGFVM